MRLAVDSVYPKLEAGAMSAAGLEAAGARLDVLAISFMLPPMAYPQAIQIGRLLGHSRHRLTAVCAVPAPRTPPHADRLRLPWRQVSVPIESSSDNLARRLARRLVPLYGRVPDQFRAWIPHAQRRIEDLLVRHDGRPDVMISFGEPMSDHLLAQRLQPRLGVPWIAHFSDPWASSPFRRHEVLANVVNRRLEKAVIDGADAVIVTSCETLDLMCRTHGAALSRKAHILPHSFEPALYRPRTARADGALTVRHVGHFYGHRTPLPLLRALERLRLNHPEVLRGVRFEMIGGMPSWLRLHPLVRRADPGLVHWLPPVAYDRALDLVCGADLLLVIDAPARESVFLPSKLVDYLGADAPILGIVPPGAAQRLIDEAGGETADPADTGAVTDRLLSMLQRFRSGSDEGGWQARRMLVRCAYEARAVAVRFDRIVTEVARDRSGHAAAHEAAADP